MKNVVYNEDCLPAMLKMKDNEFDLAIVDPPYGIGKIESRINNKSGEWNTAIPSKEYFIELQRISINQIIWGVNYYAKYIKSVGRIVHYKDLTPFLKTGGTKSDCDLASQSFDKTIKYFHYRWSGNVQGNVINWKNDGIDGRIHPTQKPIALYKWLLKKYAKEGNTVLDTHVGSGSSRIACYEMGFDFTGYEIDKDYWEAQEKRFKVVKNQMKLF